MLGVIVNTVAVIIGSIIGLLCKKGLPEKLTKAVMIGIGLCTLYIGISGSLSSENAIIVIISIVLGAICGTLLDLDGKINSLGSFIGKKFKKDDSSSSSVAEGFVTSSLLFCIGAMTITGSLSAGLSGDNSVLFTKSVLDFISAIMLSASLGIGVLCSAAFVLVFQGLIVILAQYISPFLTTGSINEMTAVGSLLIIGLGLNLIGVTKIKVSNYLPAIVFAPIVCYLWALLSSVI